MSGQNNNIIKKIKGTIHGPVFSGWAPLDLVYRFEKIISKPKEGILTRENFVSNDEITKLGNILRAGKYWHLNPTVREVFYDPLTESVKYDKDQLKNYLTSTGKFVLEEFDINGMFLKMDLKISILICNAEYIDDDIITEASTIKVQSLLGLVVLK